MPGRASATRNQRAPISEQPRKSRSRRGGRRGGREQVLAQVNGKAVERQRIWRERSPRKDEPILPEDELLARDVTRAFRTGRISRELRDLYVKSSE